MALIVHSRPDGSIVVDSRSDPLGDSHVLGAGTLQRWGVTPGQPVTITDADGTEVVFTFAGFDPELRQSKFPMLVYERASDG